MALPCNSQALDRPLSAPVRSGLNYAFKTGTRRCVYVRLIQFSIRLLTFSRNYLTEMLSVASAVRRREGGKGRDGLRNALASYRADVILSLKSSLQLKAFYHPFFIFPSSPIPLCLSSSTYFLSSHFFRHAIL